MAKSNSQFLKRPGTRLGWWSIGLAIVFIVMFIFASVGFRLLPLDWSGRILFTRSFSIFMVACGLAALVVGLIAIIGKKERSWAVWVALIPGEFSLFFVLAEIIFRS